jgi:MFS family permease
VGSAAPAWRLVSLQSRDSRREWRARRSDSADATVILLGMTSLFTDIGTEMIFPLLPVFLVETLGAGPTYLGLVEGARQYAVASVLKLGIGLFCRTSCRGASRSCSSATVSRVSRGPSLPLATRPWHALAVRLVDRVGKGVRSSPRDALIADAAGDRAGRAFGFHQAMDNVGAVVGPLLATLLIAAKMSSAPGLLGRGHSWDARHSLRRLRPRAPPHPRAVAERHPFRGEPVRTLISQRPIPLYLGVVGRVFARQLVRCFPSLARALRLGLSAAALPILWSVSEPLQSRLSRI